LRLRFRKNSLLTHMLHSGLLDPVYDDDKSSGWRSNTPSDFEGADVLGNPDSGASIISSCIARSSDSASFHQPVEREINAKADVSATSKPELGRSASTPPVLDYPGPSSYSWHERVHANYERECAHHTFSSCRPILRTYPVATHA
jgi:hypothetical protein